MGAMTLSGLQRHGWGRRLGEECYRGINLLGRTDPVGGVAAYARWNLLHIKILSMERQPTWFSPFCHS